jgi:hypothetical protein
MMREIRRSPDLEGSSVLLGIDASDADEVPAKGIGAPEAAADGDLFDRVRAGFEQPLSFHESLLVEPRPWRGPGGILEAPGECAW